MTIKNGIAPRQQPTPGTGNRVIENEQSLLGAILIDGDIVIDLALRLGIQEEMFLYEHDAYIFAAFKELRDTDTAIDAVTLKNVLEKKGLFPDRISLAYIMAIGDIVPSSANAEHYAKIVLDAYAIRKAYAITSHLQALAENWQESGDELIEQIQQQAFSLTQLGRADTRNDFISDAVRKVMIDLENPPAGIMSGFPGLDRATSGVMPCEMCVIGARPGDGKTALMLNWLLHNGFRQKIPCAFCSFEMSKEQLTRRILSQIARVDGAKFRRGSIEFMDAERDRVAVASKKLLTRPIHLADTRGWTVSSLRNYIRQSISLHGTKIFFLDYLQRIKPDSRHMNRSVEVGEVSTEIANIALETNTSIVCAAQLNRESLHRMDKRPNMGDLRESGNIEQDAYTIVLIYQKKEKQEDDWLTSQINGQMGVGPIPSELIIEKSRDGEKAVTIPVMFDGRYTTFYEVNKNDTD